MFATPLIPESLQPKKAAFTDNAIFSWVFSKVVRMKQDVKPTPIQLLDDPHQLKEAASKHDLAELRQTLFDIGVKIDILVNEGLAGLSKGEEREDAIMDANDALRLPEDSHSLAQAEISRLHLALLQIILSYQNVIWFPWKTWDHPEDPNNFPQPSEKEEEALMDLGFKCLARGLWWRSLAVKGLGEMREKVKKLKGGAGRESKMSVEKTRERLQIVDLGLTWSCLLGTDLGAEPAIQLATKSYNPPSDPFKANTQSLSGQLIDLSHIGDFTTLINQILRRIYVKDRLIKRPARPLVRGETEISTAQLEAITYAQARERAQYLSKLLSLLQAPAYAEGCAQGMVLDIELSDGVEMNGEVLGRWLSLQAGIQEIELLLNIAREDSKLRQQQQAEQGGEDATVDESNPDAEFELKEWMGVVTGKSAGEEAAIGMSMSGMEAGVLGRAFSNVLRGLNGLREEELSVMIRSRPWLGVTLSDTVESTIGSSDEEESSSESSDEEKRNEGKGKGKDTPTAGHPHTHVTPALALLAGLYERYQEQRLAVYLKLPADVQDGLPVEEFQRGSVVGKYWCALMRRAADIFGREKLLRLGVDEEDIDYEAYERPTSSRRKRMKMDPETPPVDSVASGEILG